MWLEAVSQSHHAEKCPTCGGGVRRRAHGELHAGSYVLDGQRVEIRKQPPAGFADPVYLDPLATYFDGGLYRRWPSERYWSRGGSKLHRDVWQAAFGPVPRGCHIHHRDGNPDNNCLANLECVPASEHLSRTWAAEWHKSDEGRLWHRRHAKRSKSWTKWKREPRECPSCGKTFNALIRKSGNAQIYCGQTCKVAAYRDRQRVWAKNYRKRKAAPIGRVPRCTPRT
jgi:endogenous inhibitor of DNA gyrase (YacG/DUF329 family)